MRSVRHLYDLNIDYSKIDIVPKIDILPEPVYYFIDPEYISECMVDLESDFTYDLITEEGNGVIRINIYHDMMPNCRARQIDFLMKHLDIRTKLLHGIDLLIEKIKLEYPDFKFHINYDDVIVSYLHNPLVPLKKNGTQIFRLVDYSIPSTS